MKILNLQIQFRNQTGKMSAHKLRSSGYIPAIIYNSSISKKLISIKETDFVHYINERKKSFFIKFVLANNIKAEKEIFIIKAIQKNPISDKIIHIDFVEINMEKKITILVPINFIGTPIGVKMGGQTQILKRNLKISAFPLDIPETIDIDINNLKIGESIHITNIKLKNNIENKEKVNDMVIITILSKKGTITGASSEEVKSS